MFAKTRPESLSNRPRKRSRLYETTKRTHRWCFCGGRPPQGSRYVTEAEMGTSEVPARVEVWK